MSPAVATFLFELVNFLLLALLLAWLLFKPVRAHLEARRAAAASETEALTARETALEQQQKELDERKTAFDAEIDDQRKARLAAAAREGETIVAQAREAAAREHERATQALRRIEPAEIERLAGAVATAARQSVATLLGRLDAPGLDDSLLRAGVQQLKAIPGGDLGAVHVESARPLDAGHRSAVLEALGGRQGEVTFDVTPDLGAGVRITTARGAIDASASGLAREAGRSFREVLDPSRPESTE